MEEDIKKLEKYLKGEEIYDTELDNALRNLISSYKKLEEENKELKNDISNMYDEKIVRNILEELGLSKMEIEEILN